MTISLASVFRLGSALLFVSVLAAGCSHKTILAPESATISSGEKGKGATAQILWLKNKKSAIDVMVKFTNLNTHPIFFKNKAFQMEFGGTQSGLKNPNFAFELAAGETSEKVLTFTFGANKPKSGQATLSMTPTNTDTGATLPTMKINLPVESN